MPVYKCKHPTCLILLPAPGYCGAHRSMHVQQQRKIYDVTQRDKEMRAFYNCAQWKKARALQLGRQPICQCCLTAPATIVHHTTAAKHLSIGDRLNPDHLESLCQSCHSRLERRRLVSGNETLNHERYQPIDWEAMRGKS